MVDGMICDNGKDRAEIGFRANAVQLTDASNVETCSSQAVPAGRHVSQPKCRNCPDTFALYFIDLQIPY
jgi:hypothetical protein